MDKYIDLINNGERINVEFKEAKQDLPKNIFETICAFLNRSGGYIFLGVSDKKDIIGVDEDSIKNNFVSTLNNSQKISPTVYLTIEELEIEKKKILQVYVPESSEVHSTNGKIFDRNEDGDFNITKNTNLVAQMYLRKQKEYTENRVFPFATKDDLKSDLIDKVRKIAVLRQPNHPWQNLDNDELLKSVGLYKTDLQTGQKGYTLACILLFGKDETILSALPHHKTDAIVRKVNLDRYDDREDIRCNLIESYERLMSFIEKHLDDIFYLENDIRISVRNKLFREIIGNTLIHREYSNPYPAKLIIFEHEVFCENASKSTQVGKINIDDFTPYPKNPIIAKVFKEIGWADELGSGIRNMKKFSKIYSGKLPHLIDGDIFETHISMKPDHKNGDMNHKINDEHEYNYKSNHKTNHKVSSSADKSNHKIADKSNHKSYKKIIIEHLSEYSVCKNDKELQEKLNLSSRRVREILSEMAKKELIIAEGMNKNRTYKLPPK